MGGIKVFFYPSVDVKLSKAFAKNPFCIICSKMAYLLGEKRWNQYENQIRSKGQSVLLSTHISSKFWLFSFSSTSSEFFNKQLRIIFPVWNSTSMRLTTICFQLSSYCLFFSQSKKLLPSLAIIPYTIEY